MVNVIEFGLFLYALGGSASIGYWAFISFLPDFQVKAKTYKLGYSFIAGAAYTLIVFLLSFFLSEISYNNMAFLEIFFWLIPISFIILAVIVVGKKAWAFYQFKQHEEVLAEPVFESEKESTREMDPIHTISTNVFDSEPATSPKKEMKKVFSDRPMKEKPIASEKNTEELFLEKAQQFQPLAPIISDEEPVPKLEKKIEEHFSPATPKNEKSPTKTERGKYEEDVESEIRKIMDDKEEIPIEEFNPTSEKPKPEPAKEERSKLSQEEIEKIKKELKERMKKEKTSE
ncbi:hypothetical protein KKE06_01225 [Candidatus Micrarchaeota archaeon]|nr:hypothetical protein [Candidatus Micrarchaeota archaeon]MBU1930058.1 hypothetical protein [Candidatus Micrarchaeota archaeon]